MLKFLNEIRALKMLQNARIALTTGDYAAVVDYAIQILGKLGYTSVAADIQSAVDAIGSGDKREIAAASINLILDVLNAYLGFGKPITVSSGMSQSDEAIIGRLELVSDRIDHALAPRGFSSPEMTVDPQMILVAFQILQQAFSFFYSNFKKTAPAPVPAPAPKPVAVEPQLAQ